MCAEGMAEMQITLWGHRPGFRCLISSDKFRLLLEAGIPSCVCVRGGGLGVGKLTRCTEWLFVG